MKLPPFFEGVCDDDLPLLLLVLLLLLPAAERAAGDGREIGLAFLGLCCIGLGMRGL